MLFALGHLPAAAARVKVGAALTEMVGAKRGQGTGEGTWCWGWLLLTFVDDNTTEAWLWTHQAVMAVTGQTAACLAAQHGSGMQHYPLLSVLAAIAGGHGWVPPNACQCTRLLGSPVVSPASSAICRTTLAVEGVLALCGDSLQG